MGEQHTYPPRYPPGRHWSTDEAWAILDQLRPGALDADVRAFLAGLIAGTLQRVAEQGRRREPEAGEGEA